MMSLLTTGFMALETGEMAHVPNRIGLMGWVTYHSVPRKLKPSGNWWKTSRPLIVTSAPLMSFFPARICKRVDFPAVPDRDEIFE